MYDKLLILVVMIFLHIVDDYYLQGRLAQLKQRQYWKDNAPNELYKYDYIIALVMHAFSWSFMVMIPSLAYIELTQTLNIQYFILLILNTLIHSIVDNEKANKLKINLITDQLLHIIQIIITWLILIF